MKRRFYRHLLEEARRYGRQKGLWTEPHSCGHRKVTMKRRFYRHLLEEARRYGRQKGLWTEPHSCGHRKVTMKRRFYRHLLERSAEVWPAEGPTDGVPQLRVPEGDDECRCGKKEMT